MAAASSRRRNFITDNIIWFLAALFVAVVVWITAELDADPISVQRLGERVPIEVITTPNVIVTDQSVSRALVLIRAQQSTFDELSPDNVQVFADLQSVTELGEQRVSLDWRIVGDYQASVVTISPPQITVTLERRQERFVPLEVELTGLPPASVEANVNIPSVDQVLISGPEAMVSRVDVARIRVDLTNQRESAQIEANPVPVDTADDAPPLSNLTVEPETVMVDVEIEPRSDVREVRVTPNIIGQPPDGYTLTSGFDYSPETVFVSGSPDALENLPGTLFTAPIDLSTYTDDFEIRVPVELPRDDLLLITGQRITVSVGIDAVQTSRQFERVPVEIIGLQEGLEATISPAEVSVLVNGPQPVLSEIMPDEVQVIVDLNDMTEPGVVQVIPSASVGGGQIDDENISVLPPTIDVQLTFAGAESDE